MKSTYTLRGKFELLTYLGQEARLLGRVSPQGFELIESLLRDAGPNVAERRMLFMQADLSSLPPGLRSPSQLENLFRARKSVLEYAQLQKDPFFQEIVQNSSSEESHSQEGESSSHQKEKEGSYFNQDYYSNILGICGLGISLGSLLTALLHTDISQAPNLRVAHNLLVSTLGLVEAQASLRLNFSTLTLPFYDLIGSTYFQDKARLMAYLDKDIRTLELLLSAEGFVPERQPSKIKTLLFARYGNEVDALESSNDLDDLVSRESGLRVSQKERLQGWVQNRGESNMIHEINKCLVLDELKDSVLHQSLNEELPFVTDSSKLPGIVPQGDKALVLKKD